MDRSFKQGYGSLAFFFSNPMVGKKTPVRFFRKLDVGICFFVVPPFPVCYIPTVSHDIPVIFVGVWRSISNFLGKVKMWESYYDLLWLPFVVPTDLA